MNKLFSPDHRNLIIEVFKHVDCQRIQNVTCLNKFIWELTKTDLNLYQVILNKKTDKFICMYETQYYKNVVSYNGEIYDYIERPLITGQISEKCPNVTLKFNKIRNSILVESIVWIRDLEILRTLQERCLRKENPFRHMPTNSHLALHAIENECITILEYLIYSAPPDGDGLCDPTRIIPSSIEGYGQQYIDTSYNFVLCVLTGGRFAVTGVLETRGVDIIHRNLTKREREIAELKHYYISDHEAVFVETPTTVLETIHNTAGTSIVINYKAFEHLLRCRHKLDPNVFSRMFNILSNHPLFKPDLETLRIALLENDFEVFDFLLKRVSLSEDLINSLIKKYAFSSICPKRTSTKLCIYLEYSDSKGNQLSIPIEIHKLMKVSSVVDLETTRVVILKSQTDDFGNSEITSDIKISHRGLKIPFPVETHNIQAFVHTVKNSFTNMQYEFSKSYKSYSDFIEFKRLLEFFKINLGSRPPCY